VTIRPTSRVRRSGRSNYPDGVGQSKRDGQRQSFWNGDDEDRDTDDEELEILLQVFDFPLFVIYGELLDGEAQNKNQYRQNGHDDA